MRFFRGIAVRAAVADDVISSIRRNGLNRDRGWLMVWEKPNNPESLFEKPDRSMDDTQGPRVKGGAGRNLLLWRRNLVCCRVCFLQTQNANRENDTPILIEIEADPEIVAIDGTRFFVWRVPAW